MKILNFLFVSAVALTTVLACSREEEIAPNGGTETGYDDVYYAAHATISSSGSGFNSTNTGGTLHFKAQGGQVKVSVDCGTDWLVENDSPDLFATTLASASVTVTAGRNFLEEELTGTITFVTAERHVWFATITITQNAYGAPEITVDTNEWHAPAIGDLSMEVGVEATDEWEIDNNAEWLIVERSEEGIILTAVENETFEERFAEVVLTCDDAINPDYEIISVLQDGLAYINMSEEILEFDAAGGEATITIESNFEWECAYESDWFSISEDEGNGVLTIICDSSKVYKDREGIVTFTAGDGAVNVIDKELSIVQSAYDAPTISVGANEWHAPAVGELETEIMVEATGDWTVENTADWLTVKKTETGISLTASENEDNLERTAEIVLTCTNEIRSDSEAIKVTQDGLAYITLSNEEIFVSSFTSSTSVTVESNFDWDYSYDTTNDWFTIEKDEGNSSLTISYTTNSTGTDREGMVIITAGDGAENLAEAQLSISQLCDKDALILEYTITSSSATIRLPIYGVTNVSIDWGDGSTKTTSDSNPSHSYSLGIYTITINGTVESLNSYFYSGSKYIGEYLTGVKQWGNTGLTNMEYAFYGCSNLTYLPDGAGPFSDITAFRYAFYDCSSLKELPEGLFNNSPGVTTFQSCFSGCSGLTSIPSGLFDNSPSVTTFAACFSGCSGLTSLPTGLFGNCPSVTTFEDCFSKCSGLTSIPSELFGNCPAVTSFVDCFYGCSGLTSIPSGLFDGCPSVTTFYQCFDECRGLTSVPYDLFANCLKATTFSECFYACKSLVSAPSFEGLTKASFFYQCFEFCSSLVYAPSFKGCTSVTTTNASFYDIFYGCYSLAFAPSFEGCTNLTSIDCIKGIKTWTTLPENMFAGCSSITSFSSCFSNCTALVTVPGGIFSGCTAATSFASCFSGCSALETVPGDLFSGSGTDTSFYGTFAHCSSLKTVPVNIFDDFPEIKNFNYTFYECSSIVGESPYTEIELDGEKVKVHLYERGYYRDMGFSLPNQYYYCFTNSTFSDMDSIPSNWGGNGEYSRGY